MILAKRLRSNHRTKQIILKFIWNHKNPNCQSHLSKTGSITLPNCRLYYQFSSVAHLCPTLCHPWTAACQASLSITNSWSLLKLISIKSVMPSNHLIFCCPLLLPPSIFPSIRVFSNESVLHIRWPKYWSFSFNINPSNEYSGLISFRMDWLEFLAEFSPTPQFKSINSSALSFLYSTTFTSIHDY